MALGYICKMKYTFGGHSFITLDRNLGQSQAIV